MCPSVAVTNILTAERNTGQSTTVSPVKVMTKMWNEYKDKWHMNPIPRRDIPTLYIIYSVVYLYFRFLSSHILAICWLLFRPISSVYDKHYNIICLTLMWICAYLNVLDVKKIINIPKHAIVLWFVMIKNTIYSVLYNRSQTQLSGIAVL